MDDTDAAKLGIDPDEIEQMLEEMTAATPKRAGKSKGEQKWQRHCTVIPRAWELRLLQAKRVSTYRLAIELLYLHWYGKGEPIAVTGKVAKAAKLSASSKSNALEELNQLGLIEMDRGARRSPRVTLLHTRGQDKSAHDRAM